MRLACSVLDGYSWVGSRSSWLHVGSWCSAVLQSTTGSSAVCAASVLWQTQLPSTSRGSWSRVSDAQHPSTLICSEWTLTHTMCVVVKAFFLCHQYHHPLLSHCWNGSCIPQNCSNNPSTEGPGSPPTSFNTLRPVSNLQLGGGGQALGFCKAPEDICNRCCIKLNLNPNEHFQSRSGPVGAWGRNTATKPLPQE